MKNNKLYTCKALIIGDNEVNTIVLANMLRLYLIDVDWANNGTRALKLLNHVGYDLIFVDHITSDMDGIQTTKTIRTLISKRNSIILALTSSLSDDIRYLYLHAGANEVYTKPLGVTELGKILQQWCAQLTMKKTSPSSPSNPISNDTDMLICSIIGEIEEIQYEIGLKYASGDSKHYINILMASLTDIQNCIKLMKAGNCRRRFDDVRIGVLKMKNVFVSIGAIALVELATDFELTIKKPGKPDYEFEYTDFMQRVGNFYEKLDLGLKKLKLKAKDMREEDKGTIIPMTIEEYEQSICNTIYYIRTFDYVAILNELDKLIRQEYPLYQYELEQTVDEIKDYKYENVLNRMMELKNRMTEAALAEAFPDRTVL